MSLYGLLLVVVGTVHGVIDHQPEFSQVLYTGSRCPNPVPKSCTSFSEQLEKLTTITTDPWDALTTIGKECAAAVNSDTCTVAIEVGLLLTRGNVCSLYLGYSMDESYFSTNWQVLQFQASSDGYPSCAALGMWGSDTRNLCGSTDGGERLMVNIQGNVINIKNYNPTRGLVFPGCAYGGEITVVVELIPDELPTTAPTTAEAENSSPLSNSTDEPNEDTKSENGIVTDDPEDPNTDPEKPDTDPEDEIATEEPDSTQGRGVPDSAARSAILSILLLTIIAAI